MHEHESHGGSYRKTHILIMTLGCRAPLILVATIIYTGIDSQYLSFLLILLCPLLMLLMHVPRRLPKKKRTEEAQDKTQY